MSNEQDIDDAPPEPLPLKWRRFVDAYCGEAKGNGTKAARMAGYAGDENSLASQASVLLRKPKIRAVVDARMEGDPLAMRRVERIQQLSRIARGEHTEKRFGKGGVLHDVPVPAKDIIAACRELGLLQGDYVNKVAATNAAGEDIKSLTLAELLAIAGGKGGE